MITKLIDKQDSFEIVRDQIAAILKLEVVNQMQLATAAGKDASLWNVDVFSERSNPWEQYQNADVSEPNNPIVNVWFDSANSDDASSDTVERQKVNGTFNVDCYACGISTETGDGHNPGDQQAALNLHRVIRLVRNILMAGEYTYLGLPRRDLQFVWRRRIDSITIFQPSADDATMQNIVGARIVFRVEFNEFSPQVESVPLELLSVQVKRAETGEILLATEYQYNGD